VIQQRAGRPASLRRFPSINHLSDSNAWRLLVYSGAAFPFNFPTSY
jgi:hypothetical protein